VKLLRMEVLNTLRIALKALRRNKVRSALTTLGVIIGVASVIAMIALSAGARAAIDSQIQSTGTNVVYVSAGSWGRGGGGVRQGTGSVQTLTVEDARAILELVPTVARMTPVVRGRAQVIAGNINWNTSVEGGNEEYVVVRNWPLVSGSNFTSRDVAVADKVCLLGDTVAKTIFPGEDPVGQIIRIKNLPFRVAGVLAPKGQGQWGDDQDDTIIAPYTTVQKKLLGVTSLRQVMVSAARADQVEETAVAITRLMRQRHRIQNPEEDDFSVRTVEEMAATRTQLADTMTGLLMSVASVSLLVGGIGIMNIMLVSVTERTREIGLRMAVGARTRDILRQFLLEAVSLSAFGGLAGTALGVGISRGLANVMGWPTLITSSSIVLAFAFAAAVGIFFGYYPARKAANLDPIDALRYE
jgi:putative ABC transport system permease protein